MPSPRRATPTSDHGPQLITAAGRPDALRHATRASSHALAHAYAACPGEPNSEATEENPTHQSSSQLALAWCMPQRPDGLGRPHPLQAFSAHGEHQAVVDDRRGVHDAAQLTARVSRPPR